MKSLALSRATAIALTAALTFVMSHALSVFAQTDGSATRLPQLQGPVNLEGSGNRSPTALPMFDALGNLVDTPDPETFGQADFDPIPEPIGPRLPNETAAQPQAQDFSIPENFDPRDQSPEPPAIVERNLPQRENFYQSPNTFQPAGPTERRDYSQADIERALQRVAVLEQLLKQQLRRETALRYSNGVRYSNEIRYPRDARSQNRERCGNSPRGGYQGSYGRAIGY